MNTAVLFALFFTVVLLVITGYFLLGSVPLLVLKHDTPMDSRFVRGFFNNYYMAAMGAAGAAALSYAFAGRWVFAVGATVLGLLAAVLRRTIIPKMDALRAQIQLSEAQTIRQFRRIHLTAILVNLAQLVVIVGCLITVSMQMR